MRCTTRNFQDPLIQNEYARFTRDLFILIKLQWKDHIMHLELIESRNLSKISRSSRGNILSFFSLDLFHTDNLSQFSLLA